jgi:hypothetical protein
VFASMLAIIVASAPMSMYTFQRYDNADNAHGRWNTSAVSFLGRMGSVDACERACVAALGSDPTAGCTAFTYYAEGHYRADLVGSCYGDNASGYWRPFYSDLGAPDQWGNVTSGQNAPSRFRTPCLGAADCSFNGKCSKGFCACYPQWMGRHCGQLNLVPTARDAGLQTREPSTGERASSWGGSVVRGDDGVYHMYAAEMTHHCGIVVWLSNSQIRHAVSTRPDGPFVARDVAEGVWGHEPTAARAPSGEYVLFWTASFGKDVPCSKIPCENCKDGDSTIDASVDPHCLPDTRCTHRVPLLTYMSYATDPSGPWSEPVAIPSPENMGDTNFAPIIRQDGSLVALGRPPWVWRAAHWKNASSYTFEKAAGGRSIDGEDPFLYVDPREPSILHGLSHAGGWDSSGGHVWSEDGGKTWSGFEDVAAYGSRIEYEEGEAGDGSGGGRSYTSLSRRERPHLIFDVDGLPVALTNGATDAWPCTHPENCPRDHCFTALQRLKQTETPEQGRGATLSDNAQRTTARH